MSPKEQESLIAYKVSCFTAAQTMESLITNILEAGPSSGYTKPEQKLASIAKAVRAYKDRVNAEIEDHCSRFPDSE